MSQTRTRVKTTRNFELRGRGSGNTYHQKRNHSSASKDNEKQHLFEGDRSTQPSRGGNPNRKMNKRGRGHSYSRHNSSKYNSNGRLDSCEEPQFVEQDILNQEACNYLETRSNNNFSKRAITSKNLYPLSGNNDKSVSDFSGQDKSSSSKNSQKQPIHSQNPIFVGELANRFHSILPRSIILSSEGPPQRILENEDNLNNQTADYYPGKNEMQKCLAENNPHYPFMHCNMGDNFTHPQESQAKANTKRYSKHKQKTIQSTSSSENRSAREINYSSPHTPEQLKVKGEQYSNPGFKQKSVHSAENKIVKEITSGSKDKTNNHKKLNAHQSQPEPFFGGHVSFHNQNESCGFMGDIQFSKLDEFALNNNSANNDKDDTHQIESEIPEQDLSLQIRAFVSNSKANKHPTTNQTKPNANDFQGKCTPSTYNKHVMDESTSSCKTKFEQTKAADVGIDNTLKDSQQRNEILKSFGFPGKPTSQDNTNKQAKKHVNLSSEITVSHNENLLETTNSCHNNKGNHSKYAMGRTLHSQRESFQTDNISYQKKLELPARNDNNIPYNRNRSSNVSYQSSRNINNPSPYEFPMDRHPNSQNAQFPNRRNSFNKLQPEINRSDSKINMFDCTNQSTFSNSDLNSTKVAGGNVYNIRQPINHMTQGVASRNEVVRRLQDEYAGHLVEYQRKEQEKEAIKREKKLARYKYVDQGYQMTEGEGYFDEAVGGYDPEAGPLIESEEEVRRRQQEQLNRDALIYQEFEQQKNERSRQREEEKKKKEMEKYKYVSHGYKLGGNENSGPQDAAPVLQNLPEEKVRLRQQEMLKRDALAYEEQERQKNEKLRKMVEEKKKNELEKYKHVSSGFRLGGNGNLDSVGGPRRNSRNPQHDSSEVSKQDSQLQNTSGGPAREVKEKGTLDDSSQAGATTINNIDEAFLKFLQTNGILTQANSKEAEELKLTLLSQLQNVVANANKTSISETQDSSLANSSEIERNVVSKASTSCTEKSTAIDSSNKPASYVFKSADKGPILMLRPSQEALENSISHQLAVQDLDKHGHSATYTPHVEQTPIYSNNRFQQKPSSSPFKDNFEGLPQGCNRVEQRNMCDVVETHSSQKSLDEAAKSAGTIPKQNHPVDNLQALHVDNSTTSLNKTETAEIDYQEELRAVRLMMQKRYDEAIKNQVNC